LLVTFDEHGGCYDHVPPPAARMPETIQPEGDMGFFFDRLDVPAPAIAISAYTGPAIVKRPVHHAALVRTLRRKFGLPHLTERDVDAPDLADAINHPTMRDPSWPVTVPPPQPPASGNTDPLSPQHAYVPLNDLERHFVATALDYYTGRVWSEDVVPKTIGAAYTLLKPYTAGKFGST
jgi:phospholipase C